MLSQPLANSTLRGAVNLEGLKAGEVRQFASFLREMDKTLRRRLIGGPELTEYTRTRLERLIASTRSDLSSIFEQYRDEFGGRLNELAEYASEFEASALSNIGWESVIPAAGQVRAAVWSQPLHVTGASGGMLLESFLRGFSEAEVNRLSNVIRQSAYEGATIRQTVQRIRGTRANNYADGLLKTTARNAEAIARTSIQHVSSTARLQTWKANDDVVIGYRWLSTLDSRTSTICRSLDGRVFKFDKGPVPPAHINCRSTTLAELDGRFSSLDTGGTRAGRSTKTGKTVDVPAESNYYEWLRTQPREFQDSVIGPVRGKLLRDGGLSARRFAELQLDRNFTPLTLEEMRRLEPLAFQRAFAVDAAKSVGAKTQLAPFAYEGFKPVKRVADAESYLVANGVTESAKLKGLKIDGLNQVLPAMHEATERFGLKPLAGVGPSTRFIRRKVQNANAAIFPTITNKETGAKGIFHAPTHFGDPKRAAERSLTAKRTAPKYRQNRDRYIQMRQENPRRLGAMDERVEQRLKKMDSDRYGWTTSSMADASRSAAVTTYHEFGHVLHLVDDRIGPEVNDFLKQHRPRENGWQFLLSEYAGSNNAEYVAEAFAVYMSDPAKEHIRIHPSLLKIFKKYDRKP